MRKAHRKIGGALLVASLLVFGFANRASAQASQSTNVLPKSPYSGGVVAAQAVHAGLIRPVPGPVNQEIRSEALSCTPAPCVLPNVQASEGGSPVNEDPVVANLKSPAQLLTGGNDYNCSSSLQGFYASSNGGSTWNHNCLPTLPGGSGDGDPTVGYDLNGHAFAGGIGVDGSGVLNIVVSRSLNNGTTWTPVVLAVKPLFSGGSCDKDWMQIDTNPGSPHANSIYISNTQFDPSSNSEITVTHSNDFGKTWTTAAVDTKQIYPGSVDQFTDLAIGKDGTVYVSWQRCPATGSAGDCGGTTASMMFSKSTDGGTTWSTPVVMTQVKLTPDNCGFGFYGCVPNTDERVSNIPAIDVDNSSGSNAGKLYAVVYNWTGNQMQVEVVSSADGGVTWGTPVKVAPSGTPGDEFFPWLTVSRQGYVGVSWLDRRNDPSNLSYEAFAAVSTDGGSSFGTNEQLTSTPSNPDNDGFGGTFMGDYTGNYWRGNVLWVSWMDTSSGVNAQDHVGGFKQ